MIDLIGKEVEFKGQRFTVIRGRRGRRYINFDVVDRAGKPYGLRVASVSDLKVVGRGSIAAVEAGRNKHDEIHNSKYERNLANRNRWAEMDPRPGKYAVVRCRQPYSKVLVLKAFAIRRVTAGGFYTDRGGNEVEMIVAAMLKGRRKDPTKMLIPARAVTAVGTLKEVEAMETAGEIAEVVKPR